MHVPRLRLAAFALVVAGLMRPDSAAAQDIPDDIPDAPEGLDERREKRLQERHHATISRLFASTKTALALSPGALGYGVQVAGGTLLDQGSAILGTVDVYQIPVQADEDNFFLPEGGMETVYTTSLQLQLRLRRLLAPSKLADRGVIGLGMGWSGGSAGSGGLGLMVTPEYLIPINPYWSLPVGFSLNAVVSNAPEARRTFVGLHVGLRTHFGQRRQLR